MEPREDDDVSILERIEISSSDEDGFNYDEVEEDFQVSKDDSDAFIAEALKNFNYKNHQTECCEIVKHENDASLSPITQLRPTVPDDYIRNFLIKTGMTRSLDTFNTEWYELKSKGLLGTECMECVPDIYLSNESLREEVSELKKQLAELKDISERARETWDKFRKERDFHRRNHQLAVQEKERIATNLRLLKKHFKAFEPTLEELQRKYQTAMKEKMLTKLELDRYKARIDSLNSVQSSLGNKSENYQSMQSILSRSLDRKTIPPSSITGSLASTIRKDKKDSKFPNDILANQISYSIANVHQFSLKKSTKAHKNSISALSFHPQKDVIVTASDDQSWKIWNLSDCELIMSGEGHSSWISGASFHPHGSMLGTGGGDIVVKLWDLQRAVCTATFEGHTQAVWDLQFHHSGSFLASCSMDQTIKLWDLGSERCRQTLRGHIGSVNSICWQPFTSNICSGSGDKTVSLWDARSGLCVKTFFGHTNSVNHVCMNSQQNVIASCDADGYVRMWDIRNVTEYGYIRLNAGSLSHVCVDRSGKRLVVGCNDGVIRVIDVSTEKFNVIAELKGHEDLVQVAKFNPNDDCVVSAGSDCTFKVWSP